jgi:hypothetical protein
VVSTVISNGVEPATIALGRSCAMVEKLAKRPAVRATENECFTGISGLAKSPCSSTGRILRRIET